MLVKINSKKIQSVLSYQSGMSVLPTIAVNQKEKITFEKAVQSCVFNSHFWYLQIPSYTETYTIPTSRINHWIPSASCLVEILKKDI